MKNMSILVSCPMKIDFVDRGIKAPQKGEVLIKVKAAGLCGTDMEVLSNELFYYTAGMAKLPITPGHEWSGVIEALGDGVTGFAVGDHVTGECTVSCGHCEQCVAGHANLCVNRTETGVMNRDGGYAQYITFPATHLHKFTGLSFEEGAVIEPTCVAANAVIRGRVTPRDNVLVIGPGPIGLLAAQIAKKVYGAKKVFITGTRDERLIRAKEYTDAQINVRNEDVAQRISDLTDGQGIDVILETAGASDSFDVAKNVLAPAGRIVLCGFFGEKHVPCSWDFISTSDAEIIGSLGSPGIWDFVISLVEDGKLDVKSVISHTLPLRSKEDFLNAVDIMTGRKDNVCKVVLIP